MAKKFTMNDLYNLVSANTAISTKTAERVVNQIINIILSELQYNDKIVLENFGRFDKTLKGGADELSMNELGFVEKKYVPITADVSFTPSKNFLKKLMELDNGQVSLINAYQEQEENTYDVTNEEIESNIIRNWKKILAQKEQRMEKERKKVGKKKKMNQEDMFKGVPIRCMPINKVFPSISECARKLNIDKGRVYRALNSGEDCFGYKFYREEE